MENQIYLLNFDFYVLFLKIFYVTISQEEKYYELD